MQNITEPYVFLTLRGTVVQTGIFEMCWDLMPNGVPRFLLAIHEEAVVKLVVIDGSKIGEDREALSKLLGAAGTVSSLIFKLTSQDGTVEHLEIGIIRREIWSTPLLRHSQRDAIAATLHGLGAQVLDSSVVPVSITTLAFHCQIRSCRAVSERELHESCNGDSATSTITTTTATGPPPPLLPSSSSSSTTATTSALNRSNSFSYNKRLEDVLGNAFLRIKELERQIKGLGAEPSVTNTSQLLKEEEEKIFPRNKESNNNNIINNNNHHNTTTTPITLGSTTPPFSTSPTLSVTPLTNRGAESNSDGETSNSVRRRHSEISTSSSTMSRRMLWSPTNLRQPKIEINHAAEKIPSQLLTLDDFLTQRNDGRTESRPETTMSQAFDRNSDSGSTRRRHSSVMIHTAMKPSVHSGESSAVSSRRSSVDEGSKSNTDDNSSSLVIPPTPMSCPVPCTKSAPPAISASSVTSSPPMRPRLLTYSNNWPTKQKKDKTTKQEAIDYVVQGSRLQKYTKSGKGCLHYRMCSASLDGRFKFGHKEGHITGVEAGMGALNMALSNSDGLTFRVYLTVGRKKLVPKIVVLMTASQQDRDMWISGLSHIIRKTWKLNWSKKKPTASEAPEPHSA